MQDLLAQFIEVYLWPLTLGACTLAIATFASLVTRRYFADKDGRRDSLRKDAIKKALLVHLASPLRSLRGALVTQERDFYLLAEVLPPLLATISGRSRKTLLADLQVIGFYDWLYGRLYSVDVVTHNQLIRLAAHWPEPPVIRRLYSLIACGYPLLRATAAEALASTADPQHLPVVVQELSGRRWRSAPLMCDILQRFGGTIAPQLTQLLGTEQSPTIAKPLRLAALMALQAVGGPADVYQAALGYCSAEDEQLRAQAFTALAESGEPAPLAVLTAGATDGSWKVRQLTVGCALNSVPVDIALLVSLLEDSHWLVGLAAARALQSSRVGSGGRQLLITLSRRDSLAGHRARMILAEQKPEPGSLYGVA